MGGHRTAGGVSEGFKDNRVRLFGRAADLGRLEARVDACARGLTVLTAKPLTGKTWLLTELGRRLDTSTDRPFLVGYHEITGQEPDGLLRVLKDLYGRWLADAGMRAAFAAA